VLEAKCSRSIDVVRSRMNLKQKVVGTFEGEVVGPSVMEVSLRLVEHDEEYSERLEIVNGTRSVDLR
ncbi:hypothetical protein A2U01_0088420, partial [Trifolium medium]|nr:hypothetical protein [Trifolium medium]